MKRPWAALGLVLALSVIMPGVGTAQSSKPSSKPVLGLNYPNPYNPKTFIPFKVGGFPNCAEPNKMYRITMRVYNILSEVIAVPVLNGGASGVNGGTPLNSVMLPCGDYTAFWDGKVQRNGREAASGIYIMWLEQDGVRVTSKSLLAK